MLLDEIAAAIIGVEPNDKEELKRIQKTLTELKDMKEAPSEARYLANEAASHIGEILDDKCDDPDETLQTVGQLITSMQILFDVFEDKSDLEIDLSRKTLNEPESTEPEPGDSVEEPDVKSEPVAEPVKETVPEVAQTPSVQEEEEDSFEDDPELVGEFVSESFDHLQNSEAALLSLEVDPDDEDALSAVFRAFHTIKGTAGFLNLQSIQTLAHKAENLLDRARKKEIELTGGYADLALESADMLKQMINVVQESVGQDNKPGDPEDLEDLLERLSDPEGYGVSGDAALPQHEIPRLGDILVSQGKVDRAVVEKTEKESGVVPLGEALVKEKAVETKDVAKALRAQKQMAGAKHASDSTVRISTERLDNLINMIGEVVIVQSMISQNDWIESQKDRALSQNVSQMSKITRDLQDLSMSMRMVPLKGTFQKMARLVRDLSHKAGKQVKFVTDGEDTEIDRNMVELINDPLVHMVRNSVDHGIESPEDRIAAGKPPSGTVTLRAFHTAGNVVIEIKDDGKGLDKKKILNKAIENGTVDADKDLSDNDIFKLIFQAGLSTAEKVTDVSGRGVGMDVVRKNVESMRGRIDVSSTQGTGSTFALKIPLTLAIIDGMLLQVGSQKYIVPTLNVKQAFRPEKNMLSSVTGKGEQVLLRGNLLPVFKLFDAFKVEGAIEDPTKALLLVVEHEGESCALLADELLGQQQVVIKTLGDGMKKVDGVSGAAILGDGHVGLILDVMGVMAVARGQAEKATA